MRDEDPLESWSYLSEIDIPPKRIAEIQAIVHNQLEQLSQLLNNPPLPKTGFSELRFLRWNVTALSPEDLNRAQILYHGVYTTGGNGSTYVQEGLLNLIAVTQDVASIPFWLELLDLSRARDSFTTQRRTMALAALALLAINHDASVAKESLRQVAHRHAQPDVRALAIHYWGLVYFDTERSLPPEAVAELTEIATEDRAFTPRFQARAVLRQAGLPIPMDNPGGVYAFKVKFQWAKRISRTIELKSEQTLDDLHYAIQRAIKWDSDHLYSFYLNGELYDRRYAFACPYEDDNPPWTDDAIIGELGLVKKHKFLYYFDYGDSHRFEVEVVDIRPQAEPGKYPRLVDSQGQAPSQYGYN